MALYTSQNKLPALRRELQKDLRAFVKRVGPELGPIYTDEHLEWGEIFRMQKVWDLTCQILLPIEKYAK